MLYRFTMKSLPAHIKVMSALGVIAIIILIATFSA